MLRAIFNYMRGCRCKHDFEFLAEVETHGFFGNHYRYIYRCKRCGFIQRVRL